ncbi:MAG: hypothetical protein WAQ53_13685 [Thiofilum sp.]|uniref:hypothetical protein n=1 Tax=Thiofilum sp. TaxID=2212733 RepID=UPI0025FA67DE|nr:hypothetical protein [Thiofilum sp.]MBK8453992.1 hypothetical protein [Thiofilum sp.]
MSRKEKLIKIFRDLNSAHHYSKLTDIYNLSYGENLKKETINSILSDDISRNSEKSIFVRVSMGYYGLREWLDVKNKEYQELIYSRKKTDPLDEFIAVIDKKDLNKFIDSAGVTKKKIDGERLSKLSKPMYRKYAEETTDVIQLVSVFLISYNNQILTLSRTNALPEKRLRNTISVSLGGHISYEEAHDIFNQFDINDSNSLISRELREEISITKNHIIEPVGYIYDNTTNIGIQHLGLLHLVKLYHNEFSISEKRFFINPAFKNTTEIRDNNDIDFWSASLLDYFDNNL